MLPNWEKRPEITANLLNPAFCSEIMRTCIKVYEHERNEKFPFFLSILILPLILNGKIRDRIPFPKSRAKSMHGWVSENQDLKIDLAKHISNFLPFTMETIMFAMAYGSWNIDDQGYIYLIPRRSGNIEKKDADIDNCLVKAKALGKLLSTSNPETIFSSLGIKP